jgi:hypothetical protein
MRPIFNKAFAGVGGIHAQPLKTGRLNASSSADAFDANQDNFKMPGSVDTKFGNMKKESGNVLRIWRMLPTPMRRIRFF